MKSCFQSTKKPFQIRFGFRSLSILLLNVVLLGHSEAFAHAAKQENTTTTWLINSFPNTPPKARDRSFSAEKNAPTQTPSVLLGVYDVENDSISVKKFGQPRHGEALLNQDGTFLYTPQKDYLGKDQFAFTIIDSNGGESAATMKISVLPENSLSAASSFREAEVIKIDGKAINHGDAAIVPKAIDWDGDQKVDIIAGVNGNILFYKNTGTTRHPTFRSGVKIQAGGEDIQISDGRISISIVDMNKDALRDIVAVATDRKIRLYLNTHNREGIPSLAPATILAGISGEDFLVDDLRVDIADWNGDGWPDVVTGSRSGQVKIAYNTGGSFELPTPKLDIQRLSISGSYNLNVRLVDINLDNVPDFVTSYNWGSIYFRINQGTDTEPILSERGQFDVRRADSEIVDFHKLCDGPIVDFADFNGDGVMDLIAGGERGGKIYLAFGNSGQSYVEEIRKMVENHPKNLGVYLDDPKNSTAKKKMQSLHGALYDYAVSFASPSQKERIFAELAALVRDFPQYFKLQKFDLQKNPGMPSLAVQTWLTMLMTSYYDPSARKVLADAANLTGGYRRLVVDLGLIYSDNNQSPDGANAIYEWLRTIPREVYPGTCITAADWMGGKTFLVRGHMKNTFNGHPVDGGEYGFRQDARKVIGDRGSENWFMTVVHHEACHDLDAYVRKYPDLTRRWGQVLVRAGGPDMRANPTTGWFDKDMTKRHFKEVGFWNGKETDWDNAWKQYWEGDPGKEWHDFGFMRGNIEWFYGSPQESLATQGNQYWNSTEGRIQVALDRWQRGYKSNLTEVLFFLDIWSLGYNVIKFYENDNSCNQVIEFAELRRNQHGYIDRIGFADRYYEFKVNSSGVAVEVVHAPAG